MWSFHSVFKGFIWCYFKLLKVSYCINMIWLYFWPVDHSFFFIFLFFTKYVFFPYFSKRSDCLRPASLCLCPAHFTPLNPLCCDAGSQTVKGQRSLYSFSSNHPFLTTLFKESPFPSYKWLHHCLHVFKLLVLLCFSGLGGAAAQSSATTQRHVNEKQ